MTLTTGNRMKANGFTLVEIMVTIVIISLLMALSISIVGKVSEKSKISTCSMLISNLTNSIESFKASFGKYPKDYIPDFSSDTAEIVQQRSTCVLLLALTHYHKDGAAMCVPPCPCNGDGPFFQDVRLGDNAIRMEEADIPTLEGVIHDFEIYDKPFLTFTALGLSQIDGVFPAIQLIDPWGNPLIYDEKKSYSSYVKGKLTSMDPYIQADHVGIRYNSSCSGNDDLVYKMPYILYSFGPNGVDDTNLGSTSSRIDHGDDIGNW